MEEIFRRHIRSSFANPAYAVKGLAGSSESRFALMAAHLRESIREVFRGNLLRLTIAMELFVEVYNTFEDWARAEAGWGPRARKRAVTDFLLVFSRL